MNLSVARLRFSQMAWKHTHRAASPLIPGAPALKMSAACGRRIPSPTPQPGQEKAPPPRENNASAASSEEGGRALGEGYRETHLFRGL